MNEIRTRVTKIMFSAIAMLVCGKVFADQLASHPTTLPSVDSITSNPLDAVVTLKLDKHVENLKYSSENLATVLVDIQTRTDIKITTNWIALEKVGVSKTAPVTAHLRDIKTSKALDLILRSVSGEGDDHKLVSWVSDGTLIISSQSDLITRATTKSYDVTSLLTGYALEAHVTQAVGMSGALIYSSQPISKVERFDEIKKYLMDNVDTNSWKDNGGDVGEISGEAENNTLVIKQLPKNQRAIESMLKSLADAKSHPTTSP